MLENFTCFVPSQSLENGNPFKGGMEWGEERQDTPVPEDIVLRAPVSAGDVVQLVEGLSSLPKALGVIPQHHKN